MIVLMVSEFGYRSDPAAPGAYRRYLDLVIEGLRARPGGAPLGDGPDPAAARAITAGWSTAGR